MVNALAQGWPPEGPKESPEAGGVSDAELAHWYEVHLAFVWRTLRRHGVDEPDLEDAAQEVFIVAHRRREDFEGRAAPRTWLYAIARRVAADDRRGRARRARREQAFATREGILRGAQRRGARQHPDAWIFLESFLESLEDELREAFVLFELEGLRGHEAAELTGQKANTLYARRRRARARFAEALAASEVDREALGELTREREEVPRESKARVASVLPFMLPAMAPVEVAAPLEGAALSGGLSSASTSAWSVALASAAATALLVGIAAGVVRSRDEAPPVAVETAGDAGQSSPASESPTAAPTPVAPAPAPALAPLAGGTPEATAQSSPDAAPAARPEAPLADPIEAEVEAQRRARERLSQGDAGGALAEAETYLRDYPRGRFVLPTKLLRIEALCALGRHAEGRGQKAMLLDDPRTDARTRAALERVCVDAN